MSDFPFSLFKNRWSKKTINRRVIEWCCINETFKSIFGYNPFSCTTPNEYREVVLYEVSVAERKLTHCVMSRYRKPDLDIMHSVAKFEIAFWIKLQPLSLYAYAIYSVYVRPKPSLKIVSLNKPFLFWYWRQIKKYFFQD